jgi:hypothetical protein
MKFGTGWKRRMLVLIASFTLTAPAAAVVEVPFDQSVRIEWAPAAGDIAAYFVYFFNDTATTEIYTTRPASDPWTIVQGSVGTEFAIEVMAVTSEGVFGPPSDLSEVVRFVALEEPPTEEPPAEEPPAEEPPAEEPPAEEPPAEEPPVEEPPVEEPGAGAPPAVEKRAASKPLDFDGDGATDLLFRNESSGELAIWYVEGATPVLAPVDIAPLTNSELVVGNSDYDGNGSADIAVRDTSTGELRVHFLETGSQVGMLAFAGVSGNVAGSGDFDADGAADLVLHDPATGIVEAWPNLYTEGSEAVQYLTTLNASETIVAIGDLSANGVPELAVAEPDKIMAFAKNGETFESTSRLTRTSQPNIPGLCQMSGGEALSVIARSWLSWAAYNLVSDTRYLNFRLAYYAEEQLLRVGDFSGNGRCQVLIQETGSGTLWVGTNSTYNLYLRALGTPPAGWTLVGVGNDAP